MVASGADDIVLRPARVADLSALLALEHHVFTSDRMSRRSLRRFIGSPQADFIVAMAADALAGCALVLYRESAAVARLYSIQVAPGFAGRGLGRRLLAAAEEAAARRGARTLRLEVDTRNTRAASLYRAAGYREFATRPDYYEDGGTALRFEKLLVHS